MCARSSEDVDSTPWALAALLHYPEIVKTFIDKCQETGKEFLILPSGASVLRAVIQGGSLNDSTFAKIVRHGQRRYSRAEQTIDILMESGAKDHLSRPPGTACCSAVLDASLCQNHILEILQKHGAMDQINELGYLIEPGDSQYDTDFVSRPLFVAIQYGKHTNVQRLLNHGADPRMVMNPENPVTILQACAECGYQNLTLIAEFIERGVNVDDGPPGFTTALCMAVTNRNYVLADFLRERGANVNALAQRGLLDRSDYPATVLSRMVVENSPGSVSCIQFLFRLRPNYERVNCIVEPDLNHTIFHRIALTYGDGQDKLATLTTLDLCVSYFGNPETAEWEETSDTVPVDVPDINQRSFAPPDHAKSEAVDRGGNTALHLAVLSANLEVLQYLLTSLRGVDTTIRNDDGMTALEIAEQAYPSFESQWKPKPIPRIRNRQLLEAQERRNAIVDLLTSHAPPAE
ncbi:uncharacterized protein KY384_001595 [Bacidia gigantensis]|uniref:uncharacterized protein n=1 Tax=Bacidia gigantensis TaxID=2732470 RepID=UPI001D036DAF|nr:uncharacterized protein KY384_001595 [Bacidia gigantensis]KAG8533854.1 hypothetical protein KY384_001595 [Bacidia gigantensis]